jgi:hypothetical protein
MRRGYLLVEALLMIFVLATALVVFAPLNKVLMNDIPRSFRAGQVNTVLLDMLEYIRKDIDDSGQVLGSFGDYVTNENVLLLEQSDGVIGYELKDDQVSRFRLSPAPKYKGPNAFVWSVPNAGVSWQVWKRNETAYAVEVQTYIIYEKGRRLDKRMENSHLYFLDDRREEIK